MNQRPILPACLLSIATALAGIGAAGCSPRPPTHGTVFVVTVETKETDSIQERQRIVSDTNDVMARRMAKLGLGNAYVQSDSEGRVTVTVPRLQEADLANALEDPFAVPLKIVEERSF